MLLDDLPLAKNLTTLDKGALLDKVKGPILSAVSLILFNFEGRVVELSLGQEVTARGLTKLLESYKVSGGSLVLSDCLKSLLVDFEFAVLFEVQDVAFIIKKTSLLVPKDCFGPLFLFWRHHRWL
jgi:hypothetical protein